MIARGTSPRRRVAFYLRKPGQNLRPGQLVIAVIAAQDLNVPSLGWISSANVLSAERFGVDLAQLVIYTAICLIIVLANHTLLSAG
jgi:hypothetical protein